MSNRTKTWRASAILGLVALALSACGNAAVGGGHKKEAAAAPGVDLKAKTILVGASSTQTGPTANYSNYNAGAQAYFDAVNDAGGVGGWKIKYKTVNDAYQPQQALLNVQQLVNKDHIFANVAQIGSVTNVAAAKFLGNTKTPVVGCCSGVPSLSQYSNYFILEPNYLAEGATSFDYLVKSLGKKRIAVLYENDALGQPALDGIQQAAAKLGVKPVATVPFSVTDANMTPYVSKVATAHPDAIMIWGGNGSVASAMKAGQQLGLKASWIGSFFMADDSTLKVGGDAVNGLMATEYFAPYSGTTPEVKQFLADMAKYQPSATVGAIAENGYNAAAMFVWGLQKLVDSGKDITQQGLIDALDSMDKATFGTVSGQQSYTKDDHVVGYSSVQSFGFVQNKGGVWTEIAPEQPFPEGLDYSKWK